MRLLAILLSITLLYVVCSNPKIIGKSETQTFGEIIYINNFDSVTIHDIINNDGDTLKINVNLNSIKDLINNAIVSHEKPIWKGGFLMVFKNGIILKISYYGSFFYELTTDKLFVVNRNDSEKFKSIINNIFIEKILPLGECME